jgi:hypothetical protein
MTQDDESVPPAVPVVASRRWVVIAGGAFAVAAAWIVATGGPFARTEAPTAPGSAITVATTPVNQPPTVNLADAAAEEVALGFLNTYAAFDAQGAMTYVADDADLRGLIDPSVPANQKISSLMLALFEVVDYQQTITSCHAVPLSSGTHVVCGYDFTTIDAVELGRGPFTGSTFVFVVRGGEIVNATVNPHLDQYASQVRAPFAEWLAATYPTDFEVMYGSIPPRAAGFRQVHYRLTEESIRPFRLRTHAYVKAVKQGTA